MRTFVPRVKEIIPFFLEKSAGKLEDVIEELSAFLNELEYPFSSIRISSDRSMFVIADPGYEGADPFLMPTSGHFVMGVMSYVDTPDRVLACVSINVVQQLFGEESADE